MKQDEKLEKVANEMKAIQWWNKLDFKQSIIVKYFIRKRSKNLTKEQIMKMWKREVQFSKITKTEIIEKTEYIKRNFLTFFDGCYKIDSEPNTPTTYSMGLCGLEYDYYSNTLKVSVRRPGLLIGRDGEVIDRVQKYLDCNLKIIEINF